MKNKISFVGALLLSALIAISLTACGTATGIDSSSGNDPDDNDDVITLNCEDISNEHNKKLCELGIDTDIGNRTDLAGEVLPATSNPLGKQIATLAKAPELFISGAKIDPANTHFYHLLDEPAIAGTELLTSKQAHNWWADMPNRFVTSGDIDGDGLEEVVMLVPLRDNTGQIIEIRLVTIEDVEENYTENFVSFGGIYDRPLDFETGDIDNDGKDELIVIFGPDTGGILPNKIVIFDDQDNGFSLIDEISINVHFSDTAVEDIDHDGIDEIIAIDDGGAGNTSKYYIYEYGSLGSFDLIREEFLNNGSIELERAFHIAVGDFDGDKYLEIAVMGGAYDDAAYVIFIEDSKGVVPINGINWIRTSYQFMEAYSYRNSTGGIFKLIAVDLDGDSTDELLAWDDIIRLNTGTPDRSIDILHQDIIDKLYTGINPNPFWSLHKNTHAVGDFKNDDELGKEEIAIIVANYGDFNGEVMWILGYDESNELRVFKEFDLDTDNDTYFPIIAGANVDNDSVAVKYRGEYEVLFTEPVIIGVLASPPYYASGIQNTEGSATTLGKETGTSDESKHTIGVSSESSIGFEVESPIWSAAKASAKAFLEISLSGSYGSVIQTVQTQEYRTSAGKDMVIFSAIPHDVYYYTVLSSPNPDAIGTIITVNVPRKKLRIHHFERDYYNEHNGDFTDIDSTVLTHTIGDPFSYPSFAERNDLYFTSPYSIMTTNSMTVSGGGEVNLLGASLTKEDAFGVAGGVTGGYEIEAGVVIMLGQTTKFSYGYEFTHSISNTTSITGEVGDMFQDQFDILKSFDWSIFLYQHEHQGQIFPVVTYAVE